MVFNGGDLTDARFGNKLIYRRSLADWPDWIRTAAKHHEITDLVLYGDCRPYHRLAIEQARHLGIRVHVMEEGYLRPNWVTCEPDGVNGNSSLTKLDLDQFGGSPIQHSQLGQEVDIRSDLSNYMVAGFAYYFWTALLTVAFPRYISHRDLDILGEASLWLSRTFTWPIRRRRTKRALRAIEALHKPVHLVLLQLNGDSQIKEHSSFSSVRHFVEHCIGEFVASRTAESLLVFKNHPLDNGVVNLARLIAEEARRHNLSERIFFVETGKLVPLLERSISVTAVNSTACHQALRRGIPTMVLGRAVFNHPQIVPRMRLADFFRLRPRRNISDYEKLVNLLRLTSQFNGGFYSWRGRAALLPALVDRLIGGPVPADAFRRSGEIERMARAV